MNDKGALTEAVELLRDIQVHHGVVIEFFLERTQGFEAFLLDGRLKATEPFAQGGFAVSVRNGGAVGRVGVNSLSNARLAEGAAAACASAHATGLPVQKMAAA